MSKLTSAQHGQHIPHWQMEPATVNFCAPFASMICWSMVQHLKGSSIVPTFAPLALSICKDGRQKQQPWRWYGLYILKLTA